MVDLKIEPGKIITDFSDIEKIVSAVLSRMDVPELKDKKIIRDIFEDGLFYKLCESYSFMWKDREHFPQGQYDSVNAFYFKFSDSASFFLIMKVNILSGIIPTYFHEIGHIANYDFLCKVPPDDSNNIVKDEMLARSFSLWACEEFNGMNLGYCFEPAFNTMAKWAIAVRTSAEGRMPRGLRATLATLLNLYLEDDSQSAKQFYFSLRDKVYGGKNIAIEWV